MKGNWVRKPDNDTAIVFVHGFLGSENYWRHANECYWPELLKDETEFQSSGIYVFTYWTDVFSGSYSLSNIVDALKDQMLIDGVSSYNRLIFVCHSMGGTIQLTSSLNVHIGYN